MKHSRRAALFTALLTFTLVGSFCATPVAAQSVSGNITRAFSIDELEKRAGAITLTPNFLTVLKFDEAVSEVSSGNADLLTVEGSKIDPGTINVRAKALVGSTDMKVTTETGRVAYFVVTIKRGNSPLVYFVRNPQVALEAAVPTDLGAKPGASALRTSSSLAPGSEVDDGSGAPELITQLQLDSRGKVLIFYTLRNASDSAIELASLRVSEGGRAIPTSVSDFSSVLESGETATGRATVSRLPKASLTLEVSYRASGVSAVLRRELDVASLLKLAGK